MSEQDNPYQSPTDASVADEQRMHQVWEASHKDLAIKAWFFANGALKIYVNDELCYDACKWYKLTEIAAFTYADHEVCAVVKSSLIRLKISLTIDEIDVPITMTQTCNDKSGSRKGLDRLRRTLNMISIGAILYFAYHFIRRFYY